jgi:signal transduction histidine kinase
VAEERSRIARDMHDNIGAQLLRALHNPEASSKDTRIRECLADLRAIINQNASEAQSIPACLADIRSEVSERLEAAGIACDWESPDEPFSPPKPGLCHTLRSIFREAISNIIRHSHADQVSIRITTKADKLSVEIADNGCGFDPIQVPAGHGLANMRARVEELDGSFRFKQTLQGSCIALELSLHD